MQSSAYRLNIHDVQKRLHERTEKKTLCYDKVLEICHKRIIASTDREKTNCVFEFPEYIIGFPLFDMNACMEHCKKNLMASGFLVQYHFPNKFYISWDIDEIKEHKAQQRRNTPLSAIVPTPKKQTKTDTNQGSTSTTQITPQKTLQNNPQNTFQNTLQNTLQKNPQNTFQNTLQNTFQNTPQNTFQNTQQTTLPNNQALIPQPIPRPEVFKHMSFDMYQKITQPLPTAPLKYDPNDIQFSTDVKGTVLDNTFFPNNFKQLLASDIGASNKKATKKQSGTLSLNI